MRVYDILLCMSGKSTTRELALAQEIDLLNEKYVEMSGRIAILENRQQPLPAIGHLVKMDQKTKFGRGLKIVENPQNIS